MDRGRCCLWERRRLEYIENWPTDYVDWVVFDIFTSSLLPLTAHDSALKLSHRREPLQYGNDIQCTLAGKTPSNISAAAAVWAAADSAAADSAAAACTSPVAVAAGAV